MPLSLSENLARVLEEFGRPAHGKLFNKYAVGLLLDWVALARTKGRAWGSPLLERHVRAVQRGWFAVIQICEEHESVVLASSSLERLRAVLHVGRTSRGGCMLIILLPVVIFWRYCVCLRSLSHFSSLTHLNNLLDAPGRAIFRTLHQAYKKSKFTGLV